MLLALTHKFFRTTVFLCYLTKDSCAVGAVCFRAESIVTDKIAPDDGVATSYILLSSIITHLQLAPLFTRSVGGVITDSRSNDVKGRAFLCSSIDVTVDATPETPQCAAS